MSLTARQLQVADLICSGFETKEIAGQLALSPHTACKHREKIYKIAGVHNGVQLLWWMIQNQAGKTYQNAKTLLQ